MLLNRIIFSCALLIASCQTFAENSDSAEETFFCRVGINGRNVSDNGPDAIPTRFPSIKVKAGETAKLFVYIDKDGYMEYQGGDSSLYLEKEAVFSAKIEYSSSDSIVAISVELADGQSYASRGIRSNGNDDKYFWVPSLEGYNLLTDVEIAGKKVKSFDIACPKPN